MSYQITSPWADISLTTAEPPAIRNPINIRRTMLDHVKHLYTGEICTVTLSQYGDSGLLDRVVTPSFPIDREITVDSITKFEVVDEFGVDVGIGFVLGKAKQ